MLCPLFVKNANLGAWDLANVWSLSVLSSSLCFSTITEENWNQEDEQFHGFVLSASNTNVSSIINRRVSLFYQYCLEASHRMACLCILYSAWVVFPGTA